MATEDDGEMEAGQAAAIEAIPVVDAPASAAPDQPQLQAEQSSPLAEINRPTLWVTMGGYGGSRNFGTSQGSDAVDDGRVWNTHTDTDTDTRRRK